MKIVITENFQKDVKKISPEQQSQLFSIILKLPKQLGQIHEHSGIGLRKIHASGIYEARLGLGLRMIMGFDKESLYLHRIGNHDDIRHYLKNL